MRAIREAATWMVICAAAILPRAASAQAFVNEVSRFDAHPLTLNAQVFAGFDGETTPLETGAFGVRVGVMHGVLPHTAIGGWLSYATGFGETCVDGEATNPPDPLLGCYAENEEALGFTVRQGLVSGDAAQLGLELGLSAHSVPEPIFVVGLHERMQANLGISAGRVLVLLHGGAALDQTPFTGATHTEAFAATGFEIAAGSTRPSLELRVSHVWFGQGRPDATQALLALGIGFQIG